jgi:putative membrane protein
MEMLSLLADGPWHGGVRPFPFVLFPLIWVLLIGGGVTAAVLLRRSRDRLAGTRAGERVLAERFAQGEIGAEDYRSRLAELRQKP